LEIYLSELDRFFFQFASDFNLTKNLFLRKTKLTLSNYKRNIFSYFPIKLQLFFLQQNFNLTNFVLNKITCLKNFLFYENKQITFLFLKKFSYVRHLDYILIGFVSSMPLNFSFQRKFNFFVRSNLQLDIKSSKVFLASEKEISFLGFNIRLVNLNMLNHYSLFKLTTNKRYFYQLTGRINLYKKVCI
jgi:hypothetical protein